MQEHPISYALRLVATTWREVSPAWRLTLCLTVAAAGGVILWLGSQVGWALLAAGILLEVGDWLLCHLPYEPLKRHDHQSPWP